MNRDALTPCGLPHLPALYVSIVAVTVSECISRFTKVCSHITIQIDPQLASQGLLKSVRILQLDINLWETSTAFTLLKFFSIRIQ